MLAGHTYRDNGSYSVMLVITDAHGALDTAITTVTVANAPPIITTLVTPSLPVALGTPATIQIAFSDPGISDSLTAIVDWGDQTSSPIASGSAAHTYAAEGHYALTVTVRDDDGASTLRMASSAIVIHSGPPNRPPVARIEGPSTGREGGAIWFSARGSTDADGDSLRYTWLSGDGRSFTGFLGSFEYGWSYPDNGTYTVSVIAHDRVGAGDTASKTLTVLNAPPVLLGVTPPPQQATGVPASTRIRFTDSGFVDTHMITINWGDGTSDSVAADPYAYTNDSLMHTYAAPGSYRIHATVRDKDGGVDSATANALSVFDATERKTIAGYDVFDIGTLGGNAAKPLDFNDYGQIVGSSLTASGRTHAFLWENGILRDLGTLGHEGSEAQRINNAGQIAGSVWTRVNYDDGPIAAIWQSGIGTIRDSVREEFGISAAAINESGDIAWNAHGHEYEYAWLWRGDWQRLGSLLSAESASEATAINERGQIVGWSVAVYTGESPRPREHAFIFENGVMRDLGLLAFNPCPNYPDRNCGWASATSINESGQVVGFSTASDGSLHAVLWGNGTIRDLWTVPDVPTYEGRWLVINDRGQVAGSAGGEGFFWSDGTRQALGSLGGGGTHVVDMNEAGMVVGTSLTASGEQHAFVWTQAQGMVDLGTGPHGFNRAWVVGISFGGDIVGYASPCMPESHYNTCVFPLQPRAVMWRITRGSP
jgi:probable HAF family extracellular repeat protein